MTQKKQRATMISPILLIGILLALLAVVLALVISYEPATENIGTRYEVNYGNCSAERCSCSCPGGTNEVGAEIVKIYETGPARWLTFATSEETLETEADDACRIECAINRISECVGSNTEILGHAIPPEVTDPNNLFPPAYSCTSSPGSTPNKLDRVQDQNLEFTPRPKRENFFERVWGL